MRNHEYIEDLKGKLKAISEIRDKTSNVKVHELYENHLNDLNHALNLLYEYMED